MVQRVLVVLVVAVIVSTGVVSGTVTDRSPANRQADCDYVSLYDETIGSVVSVQTAAGQGSGFAYRTSDGNDTGYFVTNAHVVGESQQVRVGFTEGESVTGTVVGRDVFADLAVVRVNETPTYVESLPVANDTPPHGQRVAAFGNPFGLEETITHGIVSGVNRSLPTVYGFSIPSVVQTDTPISPGNSGGPLVDCDGTVVGVNTAGIASEGAENIGFAVPPSVVGTVAPELIRAGEYEHGYLGVATTEVTPWIATANDLPVTEGAYVVSTVEGTPASERLAGATGFSFVNGTRVPVGGDVITGIAGRPVESSSDLTRYLFTEVSPGESVSLTVIRDGERRQVNVTVAERPALPGEEAAAAG